MVLKIIGSLLVVGATSLIGNLVSADFATRPGQLRELQYLLHMLENEMEFLANLLPGAFHRIFCLGTTPAALFFKNAAELMESDAALNAPQAWRQAVEENIKATALNREDRKALLSFGELLGRTDMEGQLKNIRLLKEQLRNLELKAEETRKKNEAMYKKLGLLAGLAIVIILF